MRAPSTIAVHALLISTFAAISLADDSGTPLVPLRGSKYPHVVITPEVGDASKRLSRGNEHQTTFNKEFDVLDYVDPLIGTAAGGHVFAGATMPFGMAKPVADVAMENQGGFSSESTTTIGFSHMHDSGTGGVGAALFFNSSC
jgi:hypothetical protein